MGFIPSVPMGRGFQAGLENRFALVLQCDTISFEMGAFATELIPSCVHYFLSWRFDFSFPHRLLFHRLRTLFDSRCGWMLGRAPQTRGIIGVCELSGG